MRIFSTISKGTVVWALFFFLLCQSPSLAAGKGVHNALDFSFFSLGEEGSVILVVGGIQGDEPGGFSAATLIATRYTVSKGRVWVVPNLNFPSIIKRSRGIHGDMNRKFAVLDSKDPQYNVVCRIQEIIRSPDVCMVLNLHDGSGFYREKYQDKLHGPARWGQSVIVDQATMPSMDTPSLSADSLLREKLQSIGNIAQDVVRQVNGHILDKEHTLHVRNTHTAKGDKEMEKSLSWFAVRHGKPAFGLEASKQFSVVGRAYYHLHMFEAFAKNMGIEVERNFPLTLAGVREALYSDLSVSFLDGRVTLPLEDVRSSINFFPLPKAYGFAASKPIMAVLPKGQNLMVHYGNRTVTALKPQWMGMDASLKGVEVRFDNAVHWVPFGKILLIKDTFTVLEQEGYRVNAIGADTGKKNESGIPLGRKNFITRFSVDKGGTTYRVEVYKGKLFCGMFLVRFAKNM